MDVNKYSADEVAKILRSEGHDISKRTVNYYAFDKGMFEIKETGKNCFTDKELDKIRAIRLLRECTNLTLDQIRTVINQRSLQEISMMCAGRLHSISSSYGANSVTSDSSVSKSLGYSITTTSGETVSGCLATNPSFYPGDTKPQTMTSIGSRTIKVNDDITLIVSPNYDTEQLNKIIDFINKNK